MKCWKFEPSPLVTWQRAGDALILEVRHVGDLDIAVPNCGGAAFEEIRKVGGSGILASSNAFTSRAGGSQERCGALNWQSRQKGWALDDRGVSPEPGRR